MADEVATMSSSPALDFSAVAMVIGSCNATCKSQNAKRTSEPSAFLAERIHFLRNDDIAVHIARQYGSIEDMEIVVRNAEHVPAELRRERQRRHRDGASSRHHIPGARRGSRPAAARLPGHAI